MQSKSFQEALKFYRENGSDKLYNYLISFAIKKIVLLLESNSFSSSPDKEFLSMHDKFLFAYRSEGEEEYLIIAKVFRKAAHKIYRMLLKKQYINKNNYFLNLVSNDSN